MQVKVTIEEIRTIRRTYFVDGVNSLETAAKCAERCAKYQYQPNTYMMQEVPCPPKFRLGEYEIVNFD